MQAKDINDAAFLDMIGRVQEHQGRWVLIWELEEPYASMPRNLILAKARKLIARGLLEGCACGCRGDFSLYDYSGNPLRRLTRHSARGDA